MQALLVGPAFAVAAVAGARGLWSPCGLSMVSALNPMAERGRGHRYWLTASWYMLGALAGGAVLGAGCAVLAVGVSTLGPGRASVAALTVLAAAVCLVSDCPRFTWSLPAHPRQVNERWIGTYRRWIYAAGFGVQIGTGFATYVMSATLYLLVVLVALAGDPGLAFAVGLSFGLARGLGILAGARARTADRLRSLLGGLAVSADRSVAACLAVEAAVAAVAGWWWVGWWLAGPAVAVGGMLVVVSVVRRASPQAVEV